MCIRDRTIGAGGHVLVFATDDRPDLPAAQSVAMADMDKRVEIIFGDVITFARLAVNGEIRRVVQIRVRGSLLKIEGENGKTLFAVNFLFLPAGKTQELHNLPA